MAARVTQGLRQRSIPALALAIPCLAGLAALVLLGAPVRFVLINAAALLAALAWISLGRLPREQAAERVLTVLLLVLLALPLWSGPAVDGVARWLPLGGFLLHAGMLLIPLIVVLAAQDRAWGPWVLLDEILIAFDQTVAALALALALGALALWWKQRDRWTGAVGVLALFASLAASLGANLPPQPFVEGVMPSLFAVSPTITAVTGGTLLLSLVLIARAPRGNRAAGLPLAGVLLGFTLAALVGSYPLPLIGYGASAILGFGLALGHR